MRRPAALALVIRTPIPRPFRAAAARPLRATTAPPLRARGLVGFAGMGLGAKKQTVRRVKGNRNVIQQQDSTLKNRQVLTTNVAPVLKPSVQIRPVINVTGSGDARNFDSSGDADTLTANAGGAADYGEPIADAADYGDDASEAPYVTDASGAELPASILEPDQNEPQLAGILDFLKPLASAIPGVGPIVGTALAFADKAQNDKTRETARKVAQLAPGSLVAQTPSGAPVFQAQFDRIGELLIDALGRVIARKTGGKWEPAANPQPVETVLAAAPARSMPSWVAPVAIGGGVLAVVLLARGFSGGRQR